ncbi:hypothetical protein G7K_1964-t1 [Saitoella complicata NRRL Y-17804]|uniref:CREG-like beta-barrel domain-containing protein n=1 Tax=Saitoella complicata (strain BCRC 22490 / CBS 7301 / JCM 7358 / NBRC 10748 / NRRL Y-17804) TaxID=698492 RepID=A0A0E9NEC6_SAICN|nr:hypothetical protein G7K_1964-t1 [Saitoella complicata NRRL Y-17804]
MHDDVGSLSITHAFHRYQGLKPPATLSLHLHLYPYHSLQFTITMRFSALALLSTLAALPAVLGYGQTLEEAGIVARRLVREEGLANLMSVWQPEVNQTLEGAPMGLMTYIADCDGDGNPSLLIMNLEPAYRNWAHGSSLTLSIREHPQHPVYSLAAGPRMNLFGNITEITTPSENKRIESCFLDAHPDAVEWIPSAGVHFGKWYTFEIEKIYFFGGFGNVSYIGFLPMEYFRNATEDVEVVEGGERSGQITFQA